MKLIQRGSIGASVRKWQKFIGVKDDGIFGNGTTKATIAWQEANGLVADGIVGKLTIKKAEEQGFEKQTEYTRDINEVIVHITASNDNATVEDIRQGHIQRGFSDIGYHWIVDRQGVVHKGRDEDIIGSHVAGYNADTIGISYIARGKDSDQNGEYGKYMTESQRIALEKKIADILMRHKLEVKDVSGHNQYNLGKACPCFKVNKQPEFLEHIKSFMN